MTGSIRYQIQHQFIRIVKKYAVMTAGILLILISTFVLYNTQRNLLAQSDLVRTQLRTELSATLTQADTLIHSPILWTGLMDSFSHESVLKPLFQQLNRMQGTRFVLLDYKGRASITAPDVDTKALNLAEGAIADLPKNGVVVKLIHTSDSQDLLLMLIAVMSPLSEEPIGYLLTQFSVNASLQKSTISLPLHFAFNLEPAFSEDPWWMLSEQYNDSIDVGGYQFSYDTRYATSLLTDLTAIAALLALMIVFGYFFLRRTEQWLRNFAEQLTQQLDQLVNYARMIFSGERPQIEINASRDEEFNPNSRSSDGVHTVVKTLESLLSDQAVSQEKLRKMAYEDALTGLPVYARFLEDLGLRLSEPEETARPLMFISIDINKLKHVNDIYGYDIGDRTIRETASVLKRALPDPHLLSRRSGDEFVAWVEMDDAALNDFTAEVTRFNISHQNAQIPISLTMGVARFPEDASNMNDLIFCAEYAHREAKRRSRQSFVIFDQRLGATLIRTRQIEERIATALKLCDIKPFYQPEVDMVTGKISGFEALARWNDAELGWIYPGEFLPIIENLRLSNELTQCILSGVLKDSEEIRRRFPGAKIAFNASPADFHSNMLVDTIETYTNQQNEGQIHFELELTEQDIVDLDVDMVSKLERLINCGVHVAIDDFGTRYSSLSRLTSLPLHRLKIDASFVANITDSKGEEIVRLIISLANALNLDITAEGVETIQQRDLLVLFGCTHAQGWLYHKAVSLNDVLQLPQALQPLEGTL